MGVCHRFRPDTHSIDATSKALFRPLQAVTGQLHPRTWATAVSPFRTTGLHHGPQTFLRRRHLASAGNRKAGTRTIEGDSGGVNEHDLEDVFMKIKLSRVSQDVAFFRCFLAWCFDGSVAPPCSVAIVPSFPFFFFDLLS